ncbi:hypothetical protein VFPFJ_00260 [Purpureocillium lilacinum]|uniref:Uncharacterized protein n=1 Tax=Purpureocillium lilacinum TaxID=33203 RepID=A0A179H8E0_PURLI|nr:hypothetical protein VFPFJ_00260 [Purpureocillium lilacinum]OAQ86192.1 hypothetical protein VFPBJ_00232 [Purpureocillium lilacinum]OAQ94151.1 hypothetical protein VFPFJ_00260 [Purpureocillium lilacinum]
MHGNVAVSTRSVFCLAAAAGVYSYSRRSIVATLASWVPRVSLHSALGAARAAARLASRRRTADSSRAGRVT